MIRDLRTLIASRVKRRFALSVEEFALRVHQIATTACRDSQTAVQDHCAALSLDDLYLATACIQNEEAAWREFSGAHFDFMRDFARRFLPPAAARDVADEMISELWTRGRLQQYGGRSSLRTWLGAVVAHAALNSRQAMKRVVSLDTDSREKGETRDRVAEDLPLPDAEPANEQVAALLTSMFAEAVGDLPSEDKLCLQLYYEQGLNLEELGVVLGVSGAAASRRLKRARDGVLGAIEALARHRTGESLQSFRAGVDLARVELDLTRLFAGEAAAQARGDRHEIV